MIQSVLKILTKTPTWLTVILGSFLVAWQWFGNSISQEIQLVLFATLILLTGIPHGALDHLIQKEIDKHARREYNFWLFLLKYFFVMIIYGALWYWSAGISLFIFLVISAWHFGETDLEKIPTEATIWSFTRLIYGFYILAFILLTHADEVNPIIEQMIGSQSVVLKYWQFIQQNVKQILYLLGLSLCTFFIVSQSEYFVQFDKIRLFRLAFILICTIYLPLLPAFALYFGGWHALCAFDTIHEYLRKDRPFLSFKLVYLKALPFTILSILFLGGFLMYCHYINSQLSPFPILFIFISLITLPHLIISHQMNHQTK
jgi:beta-carotene 15,15'-dioxygenase